MACEDGALYNLPQVAHLHRLLVSGEMEVVAYKEAEMKPLSTD